MDHLSRLALEWKPIYLLGSVNVKLDVFVHRVSATDGLPPYAQARIVDLIANQLVKARPRACLWLSVQAPGTWYLHELRRLVKHKIPMAILPASEEPRDAWDFRPPAVPYHEEFPEYPWTDHPFSVRSFGQKPSPLRILRILARLKAAHTAEITSLADFSETHTRTLLKELQAANLIEWRRIGKYDGWVITRQGLRLAHRSWNIPKGAHFAPYRGEFRYAGERHRRVARRWRSWLRCAYPELEVWTCWTEVPLHYGIPDALAWGRMGKREMLFWLEVDSGHSSRTVMQANYERRLRTAYAHSREWGLPFVFCLLGPPWVVEAFRWNIPYLPLGVAVIGHDWRAFGTLPRFEFGAWQEDLVQTRARRVTDSEGELPFDPIQYPRKLTKRTSMIPKPKPTKPRFSSDLQPDRNNPYRALGEEEE